MAGAPQAVTLRVLNASPLKWSHAAPDDRGLRRARAPRLASARGPFRGAAHRPPLWIRPRPARKPRVRRGSRAFSLRAAARGRRVGYAHREPARGARERAHSAGTRGLRKHERRLRRLRRRARRRIAAERAADATEMKMGDWFDLVAEHAGLPRPKRVPRAQMADLAPGDLYSFMCESRRLDNRRMKQVLGVRLRYPTVYEGLRHEHALGVD